MCKGEWTKFNDLLFIEIDNMFSNKMKFPPDMKTFIKIRQYMDQHYNWAWYIWDKKTIPKTREEAENVKPEKQYRNSRQEEFKDEIYQKWRSKFNNRNIMSTPEGKERRRMARKKSFTGRRHLLLTQNREGFTESQYGTLVGIASWNIVCATLRREYDNMKKAMQNSVAPLPSLGKELVRLWETHYAKITGVTQENFTKWHKTGDLVMLQHFLYYEAYARTVCQLEKDCKNKLAEQLYSLAEVMPFIFSNKMYTLIENKDDYQHTPLLTTLLAISNYFGESMKFVVSLASNVNVLNDIIDAVSNIPLCNVIINCQYYNPTEPRRFGVATQGVPFIMDLTEEEASKNYSNVTSLYLFYFCKSYKFMLYILFQAVFVFCTTPDVFGFNPDKENQPKAFRINSLIEFVRRCCLGIRDRTEPDWLPPIQR